MLWYHMLNKMQSSLGRKKLPWQQESPKKTPHIFGLKNELGEPHFLFLKFN